MYPSQRKKTTNVCEKQQYIYLNIIYIYPLIVNAPFLHIKSALDHKQASKGVQFLNRGSRNYNIKLAFARDMIGKPRTDEKHPALSGFVILNNDAVNIPEILIELGLVYVNFDHCIF